MSAASGTRAIIAALAANLGIAATKFIAFALTGSSSMLAESIHSVADSGNQALLLVGGKRARREATARHPFGFGRERYVYAFIVSIVLFTVGGLFALYEGVHKLLDMKAITSWHWVPIVVLFIAVGLESFSFRTAIRESRHIRGGSGWVYFIRHSRVPELPVVLLEDLAALAGLLLALLGVGLTLATGNGVWDGIATVLIGLLLGVVAVLLAIETKSLLVGESATSDHVAKIEKAVLTGGEIERIIHMKTLHLGPEELLVAAKIAVPRGANAAEVAGAIDAAEKRIRDAVPIAGVIYLEPDIYRAPVTTASAESASVEQASVEPASVEPAPAEPTPVKP
jgi:cation diffusion facilitator family transporter